MFLVNSFWLPIQDFKIQNVWFQALVELLDAFDLNEDVGTVCLADQEPKQGQLCVTAGWSNIGTDGKKLFHHNKKKTFFNYKQTTKRSEELII